MSRQATDNLYIDLEYFTPEEYYTYEAVAESALSSTATISCDASVIAGGEILEGSGNLAMESTVAVTVTKFAGASSTMTVVSSVNAVISHIHGADLFAFSNAALAADVAVIRDYNIASSATFSTAIDAVRGIYVSAQADAESLVDVLGSRTRAVEAAVDAAFSLAADVDNLPGIVAHLSSQFTQTTNINAIVENFAVVNGQFTQTVLASAFYNYWISTQSSQIIGSVADGENSYVITESGVFKTDQYGSIVWQKTFAATSISKDSSGNIILANSSNIVKLSNSGSIVWQKSISNFATSYLYVDSSDNIFAVGTTPGNILKLNSDGALQWAKDTSDTTAFRQVAVTASGNVIVISDVIRSYNSTFTTQSWARTTSTGLNLNNDVYNAVALDSSNNIYVAQSDSDSNNGKLLLWKFSQTGTKIWGKEISFSLADSFSVSDIEIDNDGNLYVFANGDPPTYYDAILKINSNDASIIWQRALISTTSTFARRNVNLTSNNKLILSSSDYLAQLPSNGTGQVDDSEQIDYITNSWSFIDAGTAFTGGTPTVTNLSVTVANSSLTISDSAITNTVFPVSDVGYLQSANAILSSQFNLFAAGAQLKGSNVDLTNEFTQTTLVSKVIESNASLSSNIILTAVVSKNAEIILTAFSETAFTVSAERVRPAESTQASEFAQSVSVNLLANGLAALSSETTQTTEANRTRDVAIATEAIAIQLTAAAKVGDYLITAESEFVQTTVAEKITDSQAVLNSSTLLSVDGIKAVDASVNITSTAEISTQADRLRSTLVEAEMSSAVTAELNIIHSGQSALDSSTTLEAQPTGTISAEAVLNSTSEFDIVESRTRSTEANFTAQTAVVVDGIKSVGYAADLASTTELSIPGERIRAGEITTESIASQLTAVAKTGQGFITLEASATLVADCSIIAENEITTNISSELTTVAVKTVAVSSTLTTVSSSSIEGTTNITADADLASEFALTATVNSTFSNIALVASAGTMSATVGVIKPLAADLSVLAFELTVGERSRDNTANLVSTATVTAVIGGVFNNQANLQGFASQLTLGKIIHITPQLTYVIPKETWVHTIQAEDREHSILAEDREYTIIG